MAEQDTRFDAEDKSHCDCSEARWRCPRCSNFEDQERSECRDCGYQRGTDDFAADRSQGWPAVEDKEASEKAQFTGAGSISSWRCPRCGELSENQFDSCWKCGELQPGLAQEAEGGAPSAEDELPLEAQLSPQCGCLGQDLGPRIETEEAVPLNTEHPGQEEAEHSFDGAENHSILPIVISVIIVLAMLFFYSGQ